MNKMNSIFKKFLYYVFCLTVLMVTLSPVYAEEKINRYDEETQLLLSMGLADPEADQNADATRGEFARIIYQILTNGEYNPPQKQYFTDIPVDDKYYAATAYLCDMGLISGYEDNSFKPYTNISLDEASGILIRILGYQALADMGGDNHDSVRNVSNQIGLYDEFSADMQNSLKFCEMYKLIYNSLFIPMMKSSISGGNVSYEVLPSEGKTLLRSYLEIEWVEGIVTDNSVTAISSESRIPNNSVKIENVVMDNNGIMINDMLGYYVKAYYKTTNDENVLIYITPMERKFRTLSLLPDEIEKLSLSEITYIKDGDLKTKTAKIRTDADYIYNGESVSTLLGGDVENGEIKLVDYDNDGIYDIVFVTKYQNMILTSVNSQKDILIGKFGETVDLSEYENIIYLKDGEEITKDKLKPYDVCAVQLGKKYATVEVFSKVVFGILSSISEDGYSVDGEIYEIAGEYENSDVIKPKLGVEGTFYLGKNDVLVYYEEASTKRVGVAVKLTNLDEDGVVEGGIPIIKIFTTDGIFESFEFKDRIKLNGKNVKKGKIFEKEDIFEDGVFIRQVVQYAIGEQGEITAIDFPDPEKPDTDMLQYASTKRQYRWCSAGTDTIFPAEQIEQEDNRAFFVNEKTWYFKLPENIDDEMYYSVSRGTLPYEHNATLTNTQIIFSTGVSKRFGIADVITTDVKASRSGVWETRSSVVVNVEQVYTENDEICDALTVYQKGSKVTYYAEPGVEVNGLEPGDIIQMTVNEDRIARYRKSYSIRLNKSCVEFYLEMEENGTLDSLGQFYGISDVNSVDSLNYYINKEILENPNTYSTRDNNSWNTDQAGQYVTGTVINRDGDYMLVSTSDGRVLSFLMNENEYEYYKTYAYYSQSNGSRIRTIKASDICVGDNVYVFTEAFSVIDVMVIE